MMRKISREEENAGKRRVRATDPSFEMFAEYLRRVYTFGCWQLLTWDTLKKSEKESHARFLETMQSKWARIQEYSQENLILPRQDFSNP